MNGFNLKAIRSPERKRCIGIDIGSHAIHLIGLEERNGKLSIGHFAHIPRPQVQLADGTEMECNPETLTETLLDLRVKLGIPERTPVATPLADQSLIIKKFVVANIRDDDELLRQMPTIVADYIPFDMHEVTYDYEVIGKDRDGYCILLAATRQDFRDELEMILHKAGFTPAVIDVSPFALVRAAMFHRKGEIPGTPAFIHVGARSTEILVLHNGIPNFTRSVRMGGHLANELIATDSGFIETDRMEQMKCERLDSHVDALVTRAYQTLTGEIQRALDFFHATSLHNEIDSLMVSGGVACDSRFLETLKRFDVPVNVWNPMGGFGWHVAIESTDAIMNLQKTSSCMAVALGCALRYNY